LLSGEKSKKFYHPNARLKRIKQLKFWPLRNVLIEKYAINDFEAEMFSDLIMQMLRWRPRDRAKPHDLLGHKWFKMQQCFEFQMSKEQHKRYRKQMNLSTSSRKSSSSSSSSRRSSVGSKKSVKSSS